MTPPAGVGLRDLVVTRVERALAAGALDQAMAWLRGEAARGIPNQQAATLWYTCAKLAISGAKWRLASTCLEAANCIFPCSLFETRLHLVRVRRDPPIQLPERGQLAKPDRLRVDQLAPEVDRVAAYGQFHSPDAAKGAPWSRLLGDAKNPPGDDDERQTILSISVSSFSSMLHETGFLREADAVVSIPPDRRRFASRGHSLPDVLAKAVEAHLAVPWLVQGLNRVKDFELRGLPPAIRAILVQDSMVVTNLGHPTPASVIVVDDVITYGATLREAARILKVAGVASVLGAALSYTEG